MFTFSVFLAVVLAVQAGFSYRTGIKMAAEKSLWLSVASFSVFLAAAFFAALNIGNAVDALDEARTAEQQQRQVAEPEKGPRSP